MTRRTGVVSAAGILVAAGPWTAGKTLSALAVPFVLGLLCLAFGSRSLLWGLVVINAIALTKVAWGVVNGGEGWAMLGPALLGLVICDAAASSTPSSGSAPGCPARDPVASLARDEVL